MNVTEYDPEFDPRGILEIRDLLTSLNEAGTTVFQSSHLLSEVEQLCTRVGIVDRGRLVLQDDLANLRAPTGHILVETPDATKVATLLNANVVLALNGGRRRIVRDPVDGGGQYDRGSRVA